jgi:hypothetical protein
VVDGFPVPAGSISLTAQIGAIFGQQNFNEEFYNRSTINLASPLAQKNGFVGQDNDFSPFYFPRPRALGAVVQMGIERGLIQNLFIVLQIPRTSRFLGVSGTPPLIGLDGSGAGDGLPNDAPILGQSFSSMDGGRTWTQVPNFNFRFSLIVSRPPEQP